ncbi:MAG: class I SAM-dependent methyltransferase [Dehalococcoidia bacterium]|nr:MAG: class I SAM-dependent methyltransferase [Dehalococcoidia bacterium]
MSGSSNPFDSGEAEAAAYDAWYDAPSGRSVLEREQRCVIPLLEGAARPWLDLGTGSGRFGAAAGAELGLDPALALLRIAARRIPSVVRGAAEALPFRAASLGAVLCVAAFEFLPDADCALREIARALRPGGRFVLGFFPRDSAWATFYEQEGRDPASLFHGARFCSLEEWQQRAVAAGLTPGPVRSTLFEAPGEPPSPRVVAGAEPGASFVATTLVKTGEDEGRHR